MASTRNGLRSLVSGTLVDAFRLATGLALVAKDSLRSSEVLHKLIQGDVASGTGLAVETAFRVSTSSLGLTAGRRTRPEEAGSRRMGAEATLNESRKSETLWNEFEKKENDSLGRGSQCNGALSQTLDLNSRSSSNNNSNGFVPSSPSKSPAHSSTQLYPNDYPMANDASSPPQLSTTPFPTSSDSSPPTVSPSSSSSSTLLSNSTNQLSEIPDDGVDNRKTVSANDDGAQFVPEDFKASDVNTTETKFQPREKSVPSTPLSRAMSFAGLGVNLMLGTAQESARRLFLGDAAVKGNDKLYSPFLTEKNAEKVALALCRMRGAALKLGQMLSIQDESIVPPQILAALERVRQGADVMPKRQLEKVLKEELGSDWVSKVREFDFAPIAAASIGQVHRAILSDGREVAVKVQYPGVADSIESDIDNLKLLLSYTSLLPKQLYLDQAIKVAKTELARECDYELEAKNQKRFKQLMRDETGFKVPQVWEDFSSKRILTTELVPGISIDKAALLDQDTRNGIGTKLLHLTLKELYVFRFMQTDPNWGNFLYDPPSDTLMLIDFGAARDFPKPFVDDYIKTVWACANRDRNTVLEMSRRLGFLTGEESEILLDAHTDAGFTVGLPFSKLGGYDFRTSGITSRFATFVRFHTIFCRLNSSKSPSFQTHAL